ncbi:oxidoreductase [Synergistales bacterium]|nr:oxidoreductase [Synergistales bacterium]
MQEKKDGQNYAPRGKAVAVVAPGEFSVGVIGLDHGHIYGMCNGLSEAGADISLVWDSDSEKVAAFQKAFPNAKKAGSAEEVLGKKGIRLVASASVPADRCDIGVAAMESGHDFFVDKPPLITREQLSKVKTTVRDTGRKWGVYYSERLHVEAAVRAGELVEQGAIGRVVQVMGWGPHRVGTAARPGWFFDKAKYGGILVDVGCHQIEQILAYAGASGAKITNSHVANFNHTDHPRFEDFGDASLICDNGVVGYFRVDWFTPEGLGAWGDGRTIILGTEGYIEIRKYINVATDSEGDHVFLVDREGERHIKAAGTCGFPFFGSFIRDCVDRTETAMSQDHTFAAIELAIEAQEMAWSSGAGGFKI